MTSIDLTLDPVRPPDGSLGSVSRGESGRDTAQHDGARRSPRGDLDVWCQRAGALVVAAVAAYSSYEHQRAFALRGGADHTTAGLWPLSVDGLLVLATATLLQFGRHDSRRVRMASWLTFGLGIVVSLAANVASAPTLAWQPVLVAGWPPVALLLAVELLAHRRHRRSDVTETPRAGGENESVITLAHVLHKSRTTGKPTAEDVMWAHVQHERSRGRMPTGAELDRIAGTNNFGRAVLRRWRRDGRRPGTDNSGHEHAGLVTS